MTTTHDPIDFVCGDNWELTGPLHDADGAPIANIASISWKLSSVDGLRNILTLALTDGIDYVGDPALAVILIEVSKDKTATIPPGTYIDWLRVTLVDGSVFTEWTGAIRAAANPI